MSTNDQLAAQREIVFGKMGRCILGLQQYELLMKRVLAVREMSGGHPEALVAQVVNRRAALAKNTLGQLVGEYGGSLIKSESAVKADGAIAEESALTPSGYHISFSFSLEMADEQYLNAKAALSELVSLRNELVHHFVERFDLSAETGCSAAATYLEESLQTIRRHHQELLATASVIDKGRKLAASFMSSEAGEKFFGYGIYPNGDVEWPSTPIVHWLKKAEESCSENGWTSLAKAILFIQADNPDLTPSKYNCNRWQQVIDRSGLFVIEKRKDPVSAAGQVWYRSKPMHD